MEFKRGDLIVTEDGYYAIVEDAARGLVREANGPEAYTDMSKAKPLPLKEGDSGTDARANFEEGMKQPTWLEDMNELGRYRREREETHAP